MTNASGFLVLALALCAARAASAQDGLAAHYTFDEGSGGVATDITGNGNDGTIHGARYVENGSGHCLVFDGVDDYVNCGHGPSLNVTDQITLEAWICPRRQPRGEAGIVGKSFTSFLLTYYSDGQCYWYISQGGNYCEATLTPGSWHHVAGTFDGKQIRLFLDGESVQSRGSRFDKIGAGGDLVIGHLFGGPTYRATPPFCGKIDEVRVYRRALTREQIRRHFQAGAETLVPAADYVPVSPVATLGEGIPTAKIATSGAVQLGTGKDEYVVDSEFSCPGEQLGWHVLAAGSKGTGVSWSPRIEKVSADVAVIEAEGNSYRLRRTIELARGRVDFHDELTNLREVPTGILIRNSIIARGAFRECFSTGRAANPTVFAMGPHGALGLVVRDNVSRIQFEPICGGLPANKTGFRIAHFALDGGGTYTFHWTVHVLDEGRDYFDFINTVRTDWKSSFAVQGPFMFFDVTAPLCRDPDLLGQYLLWKRIKIAALGPWLDYDPGSLEHVVTRTEYKQLMGEAIRVFRRADPDVLVIGCMETDWATIYPKKLEDGEELLRLGREGGGGRLSAEHTRIIDDADLPWKDSYKRDGDGGLSLEFYTRGGALQSAVAVYPEVGNYQHEFMMGQARFLIEEVGMDGYYMDEFSQAWGVSDRTYNRPWDGISVEIDRGTGRIADKYVDCSLAGIAARVDLCQYALSRGKVVVANTFATSTEEQALPVNRFAETWGFDPMSWADGVEPPRISRGFQGHLASPIGLGVWSQPHERDYARRIMKGVVTYLRNGMVYYHYACPDPPRTGLGSGGYGPINRMFPITPIELGKGFIIGKERILAATSIDVLWKKKTEPVVHVFDLSGRETDAAGRHDVKREGGQWRVIVKLKDWAEIAVVE